MDYHTHHPGPQGGYLCSTTRADWECVAAAAAEHGMIPCFGIHPWHAAGVDAAELAFELDDFFCRYPNAAVGETGLDASPRHAATLEAQRLLLHIHLGAAYRHERLVHLHGVHAWAELLELLRARERAGTLPRVHLHAWNGSHELAREFLKLGATFSVGLRELLHPRAEERYIRIPHDRLFAESDDAPGSYATAQAALEKLRVKR